MKLTRKEIITLNNTFLIIKYFANEITEKINLIDLRETYNKIQIFVSPKKWDPNKASLKKLKPLDKVDRYLKKLYLEVDILKEQAPKCNLLWPICVYDHCFTSLSFEFLCQKQFAPPTLIENYFSDKNAKYGMEKNEQIYDLKLIEFENLVVERNIHYCNNNEFTTLLLNYLKNVSKETEEILCHKTLSLDYFDEIMYPGIIENFISHLKSIHKNLIKEDHIKKE